MFVAYVKKLFDKLSDTWHTFCMEMGGVLYQKCFNVSPPLFQKFMMRVNNINEVTASNHFSWYNTVLNWSVLTKLGLKLMPKVLMKWNLLKGTIPLVTRCRRCIIVELQHWKAHRAKGYRKSHFPNWTRHFEKKRKVVL